MVKTAGVNSSSGGERLELMMVWQGSATVDIRKHKQEYGLTAWCSRHQPSSQPSELRTRAQMRIHVKDWQGHMVKLASNSHTNRYCKP
jgi:hypothetical protein